MTVDQRTEDAFTAYVLGLAQEEVVKLAEVLGTDVNALAGKED